MRAIMIMFDSLNRHMLPNYGCDWIKAPNFKRLGEKTVTFDNSFVGSLPCMPARRELHTGRHNFLHRSWGPLEPFDDSMPEILKNNGIYTHLVSDHQHYWEDGGSTYHPRYNSWEISRGQEGDPWKGCAGEVAIPQTPFMLDQKLGGLRRTLFMQDIINRRYMENEEDMPQAVTFRNGLEFLKNNRKEQNWFLQIETFDPHEPFFASQRFKEMYPDDDYDQEEFDWPPYAPVLEDKKVVEHARKRYAALLSMCDYYLGKVLDLMDEYDMWKDTMLIVNTDHGYLLGEHGWWSKSVMPTYNEIAHTPFFVWDPRLKVRGERRKSLVQTIDIAPTLLEYFAVDVPKDMEGKPLSKVILSDEPIRETAIFGYHGGHINITDGHYVYMRAPISRENKPLNEYTLMPTHMRERFSPAELQDITLADPFTFTKGCKTMKIEASAGFIHAFQYGSKLYDIANDPGQLQEFDDPEIEIRFIRELVKKMKQNNAPSEQFERMGIPENEEFSLELLLKQRSILKKSEYIEDLATKEFEKGAYNQVVTLFNLTPEKDREQLILHLKNFLDERKANAVTKALIKDFVQLLSVSLEQKDMITYFIETAGRTS